MIPEKFKLIIITPENSIPGEAGFINRLFTEGLELLHIRKPEYAIEETRNLLESISPAFYPKIVLHSHFKLLHEFHLKGAHLPEKIRREGSTVSINHIISTSFHNKEDILAEKTDFEYAFLSPIFPSISKPGYKSSIKIESLPELLKSSEKQIWFPVIALGGINSTTILQAKNMGFGGAACIGYIWKSTNPVEQFKKLQKTLEREH